MIFAAGSGEFVTYLIYLLFTLVAGYFALVLHEIAHGLVALWNGDPSAKFMGRLTMNPAKHFDLVGFIMVMLIGFGYAKPVPVNPYNFRHRRRGEFTVAIAGVCVNITLAFFSAMLYAFMCWGMSTATPDGYTVFWYFSEFFKISIRINLSLFFFNLLPIYPLDGFRIIEAVTRRGNGFCAFMRNNGKYILWALVGLSFVVTMACSYMPYAPEWVSYINVLGTYLEFFAGNVANGFVYFWGLMIPGVL